MSTFSLTSLQAYLAAPAAAPDVLGWGAGLSTPATGEYFAPGVTPKVDANFDPWWVAESSQLSLAYSVENQTTMNAETVPTPTTIALPTTAAALASVPLHGPGPGHAARDRTKSRPRSRTTPRTHPPSSAPPASPTRWGPAPIR